MDYFLFNRKCRLVSFFLLLPLTFSCEKISNETDPAKIIFGKWKMIEQGSWPVMYPVEPSGYIEYLTDSIKIEYNYNPPENFQINYWIDSLLHERVYLQDEHRYVLNTRYKYEFLDKNQKMRLDFASGVAEFSTSVWKRIK